MCVAAVKMSDLAVLTTAAAVDVHAESATPQIRWCSCRGGRTGSPKCSPKPLQLNGLSATRGAEQVKAGSKGKRHDPNVETPRGASPATGHGLDRAASG
jgi:hypothetical protein